MTILYIDTTHTLTIGIFDKDEWIDYLHIEEAKTSSRVHELIEQMLSKKKLKLSELNSFVYAAGPGAYTGMRISDGMEQVFSLCGLKTYSFYHFDVPFIYGHEKGRWIANAFKGELFQFDWNSGTTEKKIMAEKDFIYKAELPLYTHYSSAFSPSFKPIADKFTILSTTEMILNDPKRLFSWVFENSSKEKLFYYRSNEQEFKKPN